jgi:uncharacterized protein YxeA
MKKILVIMIIVCALLYAKTLIYNNNFVKYNNNNYSIKKNELKLNYVYTYFENKSGMHCIKTNIIDNKCNEIY